MAQVISIDLMGGDKPIIVPLEGVKLFLEGNSKVKFRLYGTKAAKAHITADFAKNCEFFEVEGYVKSDDDPASVIRKRETTMFQAIKSVASKEVAASVSAGNTGALMAISKLLCKTVEGIERPAICTIVPTQKGAGLLLDMGANLECNEHNLLQFAIMGQAFLHSLKGVQVPSVGILNIGSEENKGTQLVRRSYQLFKEKLPYGSFKGFVEGDDIPKGEVQVIVTDGFSGNIALKTMEGMGKMMGHYLKHYLKSSLRSKIGALIAKPALLEMFEKFDPNNYNGAMFLGLEGISVKSHGSATPKGFRNAIDVAHKLALHNIVEEIKGKINK